MLLVVPDINLAHEFGLIQQVNGLLQILAAFFVAALALVAGFPGDALDRPMGGIRPHFDGLDEPIFPTRREVLGYLFAYLSALSIIMYLGGGLILSIINPSQVEILRKILSSTNGWGRLVVAAGYCGMLFHLFGTTLLGLHYLGNFMAGSRLSRESRKIEKRTNVRVVNWSRRQTMKEDNSRDS
ncbi:hypothetical protein [Muricoccus aerilatus]|uniref:hypothetical protein n=1 Tax=Muricoccus aerilatus TaxID=452982 RepID=UPI0012EC426E|nr:hypothetical protein [Roseomonas aerilata]